MPLPRLQPHHDRHDIQETGAAEIGADMEAQLVAAGHEAFGRQQRRIRAAIGIGHAFRDLHGAVGVEAI
jgi:hypothetical protein